MTQQALEGVGVSAVSQEVDGESVAEAADVGVGDASPPTQAADEKAKDMTIERMAFPGDEQWVVGAGASGRVAR